MIKATIKQILNGNAGINSLLAAKLPVKAKYAVCKLADAMTVEMERYNKARAKIFEDAGCIAADNYYTHNDKDALVRATAEAAELTEAEVEINALPLDLEQFGNAEIEGPGFYGLDFAMKKEP
jgi:hypothetical protein